MEQIDMFSLLAGGEQKALSFDKLARMPGRTIELVNRTAESAWSEIVTVERVVESSGRRTLVYAKEGGYGFLDENAFSAARTYPVRAYEVS